MREIQMTTSLRDRLLDEWLNDLCANDHASGTIRRYKSAVLYFLSWYEQEEHLQLTLEFLTPITLFRVSAILKDDASKVRERASLKRSLSLFMDPPRHVAETLLK
jgi:hypothetical protein